MFENDDHEKNKNKNDDDNDILHSLIVLNGSP